MRGEAHLLFCLIELNLCNNDERTLQFHITESATEADSKLEKLFEEKSVAENSQNQELDQVLKINHILYLYLITYNRIL